MNNYKLRFIFIGYQERAENRRLFIDVGEVVMHRRIGLETLSSVSLLEEEADAGISAASSPSPACSPHCLCPSRWRR